MQADDLHPIEAGAEARARLIAQGVEGCLAYESGAVASTAPSRGRPWPRRRPAFPSRMRWSGAKRSCRA